MAQFRALAPGVKVAFFHFCASIQVTSSGHFAYLQLVNNCRFSNKRFQYNFILRFYVTVEAVYGIRVYKIIREI